MSLTQFDEFANFLSTAHLIVFLLSLVTTAGLVMAGRYIPQLSGTPANLHAVQASHSLPTPRVGGISVFLGLALSAFFVASEFHEAYVKFLVGAAILFFGALIEDLGFGVSARRRLILSLVASLTVIVLLGMWLPRVGIPLIDDYIELWIVGVPLTMLVTAGSANALNLVDGMNGLAALVAITAAVSLAIISFLGSYWLMVQISTLLAAAILGFLVFNFPHGKIFMGDAGAYAIGFALSWFAIAVLINVPTASPWAMVLIFFLPIADTCLAIYRRLTRGMDATVADRMHFHQVAMRFLEIRFPGLRASRLSNPVTTVFISPFVVAPAVCGIVTWNQPMLAFMLLVAHVVFFLVSYTGFVGARRWHIEPQNGS